MKSNTLHMMVGLPRSGKTTKARDLGFPIVCPDAIRLALHGKPFIKSAESIVWATAHLMVAALFKAGHTDVILDSTNLTAARRKGWDIYKHEYYEVRTTKAVCLERTSDAALLDAILRMARMVEWPSEVN